MVDKVKIPKRVGPVKLSKKVRRKAKKAIRATANPFVRDFATAAMAAASRARGERSDDSGAEGKPYRMHYQSRIDVEGSKVVEAFRTAAVDGFRRFLEGFEEGLRNAQAETKPEPKPARAEPPAKPKAPKAAKPTKPRKAARPAKPRKPRASRSSPGAAAGPAESP